MLTREPIDFFNFLFEAFSLLCHRGVKKICQWSFLLWSLCLCTLFHTNNIIIMLGVFLIYLTTSNIYYYTMYTPFSSCFLHLSSYITRGLLWTTCELWHLPCPISWENMTSVMGYMGYMGIGSPSKSFFVFFPK